MENNYKDLLSILNPDQYEGMLTEEDYSRAMSVGDPSLSLSQQDQTTQEEIAPINDTVEAFNAPLDEKDNPNTGASDKPSAPLDPREELLSQIKQMREDRDKELGEAKEFDRRSDLMNNLNKSFVQANKALSSGYANINPEALDLGQSDEADQYRKDRQDKLNDLLQEYKIKTGGEEGLTEFQKRKLDLEEKKLEVDQENKKEIPTWEEKEIKKAEIKDSMDIKKENRKIRSQMEKALPSLDDQLENVRKAKKAIKDNKSLFGTGPIDQYIAPFTKEGQRIRQALNKISLDTMVKMFEGMSKAIDSDSERAFFQSAQPSLGNFENVNLELLEEMERKISSLKKKTNEAYKKITPTGESKEILSQDDSVLLESPSGQRKRVSREKAQKYIDKGAIVVE